MYGIGTAVTTSVSAGRVLTAIILLGAALRGWGLWFGLPFAQARPDETVAFGTAANLLSGDLDPHFFHWPTLHLYVLAGVFSVASAAGRLAGATGDLGFPQHALIGRALVACAGSATIYVTFRLARRAAGPRAALAAALFLAGAVLHVRDSHFALPDIVMTLLATTSIGFVLRFADEHPAGTGGAAWHLNSAAAAGVLGGLAASTKYNGAAVAAGMVAAQALTIRRTGRPPWRVASWVPLCVYAVLFAIGFVAGTPYALLDPVKFSTDVMFDLQHLSEGHGVSVGPAWLRHATFSLPLGLGLPVYVASLGGAVMLAWRHRTAAVVLGAFAAAFALAIGRGQTAFARYVLPLLPVLCVCAGAFADGAGRWLADRLRRPQGATVMLVALALAAPSVVSSAWLDVLLARTDTRVLAADWLSHRVPRGATLYESGSDYVRLQLAGLRVHRWNFQEDTGRFAGTDMLPDWMIVHTSPVGMYTPVPVRLAGLIVTDYRLVRRFDATRPSTSPRAYDVQDAFFLPLGGFARVVRPGPTIAIYQRRWSSGGH